MKVATKAEHSERGRIKGPSYNESLGSLAADASCQLNILRHDGNSLGMDSAQIGVLEQSDEVSLGGLLKSENGA